MFEGLEQRLSLAALTKIAATYTCSRLHTEQNWKYSVLPFQGTAEWKESFSAELDPCWHLAGLYLNKTLKECEYWTT